MLRASRRGTRSLATNLLVKLDIGFSIAGIHLESFAEKSKVYFGVIT